MPGGRPQHRSRRETGGDEAAVERAGVLSVGLEASGEHVEVEGQRWNRRSGPAKCGDTVDNGPAVCGDAVGDAQAGHVGGTRSKTSRIRPAEMSTLRVGTIQRGGEAGGDDGDWRAGGL